MYKKYFMNIIGKYPILTLLTLIVINFLLAFFLISILADSVLKYHVGFIVNTPIIIFILYTFILTYWKYFSRKQIDYRNIYTTIALFVLGSIILFFYAFNLLCWIDLYDGKTNAMLP